MNKRGKGRVYPHGNYWWIDITFRGSRKRERIASLSLGKSGKKLAEAILAKRRVEISENKFLDVKHDCKITFSMLCEKYLAWVKENHKHAKTAGFFVKNLQNFLGNPVIDEISREDVQRYSKKRSQKVKNHTVNHEIGTLRHMYNLAIYEWENPEDKKKFLYSGLNPAARFAKLPEKSRDRVLKKHELVQLMNAIISELDQEKDKRIRAALSNLMDFILFALNTGMRKGEIQKLFFGSRDIHMNELDILGDYVEAKDTKNGEDRKVPLNRISKAIVKRPFFFGYNPRKMFDQMCEKAKIENLTIHDLRRTFASYLVTLGVHQYVISKLLGHKQVGVTQTYARPQDETLKEAVEKLEKYLIDLCPAKFFKAQDGHREIKAKTKNIRKSLVYNGLDA